MRQRKVKNLEERLKSHNRFFVEDARRLNGRWSRAFGNENDLYLEIGSGKGSFLIKQAGAHEYRNYIGVEGQLSVAFRALQKLEPTGLANVRFACGYVDNPGEWFSECEVSGIYLNFSDPWPKKGHAHRRLTHRNYLRQYQKILKQDGFVEFKTDNAALFDFTVQEIEDTGLFAICEITSDLHNSGLDASQITSEYEEKFIAAGCRINYVRLVRSGNERVLHFQ
ncbi:MAG: tRNA (guanosine(46)-N7)-methyltransferase TrmB [Clostridiales bacterium]|nr:tRNA (guanosine(46)-N7)-methyltransferase TrmB [Clostridiales bacterium]